MGGHGCAGCECTDARVLIFIGGALASMRSSCSFFHVRYPCFSIDLNFLILCVMFLRFIPRCSIKNLACVLPVLQALSWRQIKLVMYTETLRLVICQRLIHTHSHKHTHTSTRKYMLLYRGWMGWLCGVPCAHSRQSQLPRQNLEFSLCTCHRE